MQPKTFVAGGRTLPISLQGQLVHKPPEFFQGHHFCEATSFHFDFHKRSTGPGHPRPDQGFTVRSKMVVPKDCVLILSKPGILLDYDKYPGIESFLTMLGFDVVTKKTFPNCYSMWILSLIHISEPTRPY